MTNQPPAMPPVSWQSPPEPAGPAPGVQWAGSGERLVAYIIDGFVLAVVVAVLSMLYVGTLLVGYRTGEGLGAGAISGAVLWFLVAFVVSIGYFPYFWARGGQTPGMRVFGIRVVRDRDGGPVTGWIAILRLLGYWVSALVFYVGYIWILFDARRRGWHDLIAGTVVIKDPTS
jgi:uncharacterized RDD family membrane protein YckC